MQERPPKEQAVFLILKDAGGVPAEIRGIIHGGKLSQNYPKRGENGRFLTNEMIPGNKEKPLCYAVFLNGRDDRI